MTERADNFIRGLNVEAYRVGGSVRDEIIGRRIKDADYMVRGVSLADLLELLQGQSRKARITALKDRKDQQFGWRYDDIEIALPRREENAGAGRDQIIVADPSISIEQDAQRRDFTFNALYKVISHPDNLTIRIAGENGAIYEDIIDPTGHGLADLQRNVVRTTHPDSFRDDPLRTLRALRFVSTLMFDLAPETREQMERWASRVDGLTSNGYASGTILDEMSKILMGDHVCVALRVARDVGVLGTLFPELAPMLGYDQGSRYHDLTTDEHTFKALATAARVDAPLRVRWALLFHDAGKPEAAWVGEDGRKHYYAKIMQRAPDGIIEAETEDHEVVGERLWREATGRIGVPRELREDVATLIRNHMVPIQGRFKASKVRRGRVKFGDDMLRDLYMHRACDVSGKTKSVAPALHRLAQMEQARAEAQAAGVPASVRDLEVTGHDAMEAGLRGRDIGRRLNEILIEVAAQPNERSLSREWQLERLNDG